MVNTLKDLKTTSLPLNSSNSSDYKSNIKNPSVQLNVRPSLRISTISCKFTRLVLLLTSYYLKNSMLILLNMMLTQTTNNTTELLQKSVPITLTIILVILLLTISKTVKEKDGFKLEKNYYNSYKTQKIQLEKRLLMLKKMKSMQVLPHQITRSNLNMKLKLIKLNLFNGDNSSLN